VPPARRLFDPDLLDALAPEPFSGAVLAFREL
jgi:hypothetical protein